MNKRKYDDLKYRLLKNPFFLRQYVSNDHDCDYEKYLLELVNASAFFQNLSNYSRYLAPTSESKGECDAISSAYELDFKLAVSSSQAEGNRMLSNEVIQLCTGVIVTCGPRVKGSFAEILLNFALQQYTCLDELISLIERSVDSVPLKNRTTESIEELREHDVKVYLEKLMKDKNLLFFFPVEFFFDDDDHVIEEAVKIITKALNDYFSLSFSVRNYYGIRKDTFLCSIYSDCFLLFKYTDKGFLCVDRVPTQMSDTFTRLKQRYEANHGFLFL